MSAVRRIAKGSNIHFVLKLGEGLGVYIYLLVGGDDGQLVAPGNVGVEVVGTRVGSPEG